MAASNFKWYVYELYEPDTGNVFYVGKGSNKRIDAHEIEAANGGDSHKCRKIRIVTDRCGKIGKRKVAFFCDEKESYIHEANRIADYGLVNLTNSVLCTTLVKKNGKQPLSGERALKLIKAFSDKFANWMRITDGGKCDVVIKTKKMFSDEVSEMFYNSFCKKLMQRAIDSEDTRDKFIEMMRKYKLEITYVPA